MNYRLGSLLALTLSVFLAMASSICHAESTQSVLSDYRQEIEKIFADNPKVTDQKVRDQLLQQARAKYSGNINTATIPDKSVAQHFDALLDNIATANNSFRFKDGSKIREQFIEEAAKACQREIKSATDLKNRRTPSGWFETFAGMLQTLRDKLALYPGLGVKVAGIIGPVFMDVYKASDMQTQGDATADYKEQLALIKRLFPVSKPDLQTKNGAFATALEGFANTIFKERTK